MHESGTASLDLISLLHKLEDDPWSLTGEERRAMREAYEGAQDAWRARINELVEPPEVGEDFPAFLLGTLAFADIASRIGDARSALDLDTSTADLLQHFVDRYRDYLA